jgi:hypothetical protein
MVGVEPINNVIFVIVNGVLSVILKNKRNRIDTE